MRRRNKEAGGSLDSLLDTMTNVVGILVILLAVTQLGVSDAVKRIAQISTDTEDLEEVSAEELELSEEQAQELRKLLAQLREKWEDWENQTLQDEFALRGTKASLEELKQELAKQEKQQANQQQLEKQLAERKKQAEMLEENIDAAQEEISRLKALLANTPLPKGPPAKVVTLPNPREAPEGIKPVYFICRHGRIVFANVDVLRQAAQNIIKGLQARKPNLTAEEITKLFEQRNFGDKYVRVKFQPSKYALYLVLEHRENIGDSAERIQSTASMYQKLIRTANPGQQYVRFMVWSDSYETYVEARKIAEQWKLLAGWQAFQPNAEWRINLGGNIKVFDDDGTLIPKPRPPNPNQADKPPLPVDQID